jgi:hypothetical protein
VNSSKLSKEITQKFLSTSTWLLIEHCGAILLSLIIDRGLIDKLENGLTLPMRDTISFYSYQ